MKPNECCGVGEHIGDDRLRDFDSGLLGGLELWSLPFPLVNPLPPTPNRPLVIGVVVPEAEDEPDFVR